MTDFKNMALGALKNKMAQDHSLIWALTWPFLCLPWTAIVTQWHVEQHSSARKHFYLVEEHSWPVKAFPRLTPLSCIFPELLIHSTNTVQSVTTCCGRTPFPHKFLKYLEPPWKENLRRTENNTQASSWLPQYISCSITISEDIQCNIKDTLYQLLLFVLIFCFKADAHGLRSISV